MANQALLGNNLMIFTATTSGAASGYTAIACATSCSVSISRDVIEVSSKDSGQWTNNLTARISWEMSSDNVFTLENYSGLTSLMFDGSPIYVVFGEVSGDTLGQMPKVATEGQKPLTTSSYYSGKGYITSIEASAGDGESATFSLTITGDGELKQN